MKNKKLIILLFLAGVITIMFTLYNKFFGYSSIIKENFGVDLQNLKLSKLKENQEWSPNGDGVKIQIFKFENFNLENVNGLNPLPIKEDLPPNELPKEFLKNANGYYKCIINKEDNRNFDILIIDTLEKKICIYYQVM